MKKLYAILLGLALVLGMATVAGAYELKVTGEFEALADWNSSGWVGLSYDVAQLYIDLSGAMGDNATGELKVGYDEMDNVLFINLAKYTYNITDNFYVGVYASERHDGYWNRFFYSAVNGGEGFSEAMARHFTEGSTSYRHIWFDSFVNVYAGFKFDGGYIEAYSDLWNGDFDPDGTGPIPAYTDNKTAWYIRGSYASDALTANVWLTSGDTQYNKDFNDDSWESTIFVGKLAYAVTDELTLTGGVASINSDVFLGVWAKYAIEDVVTLNGYLEYDVKPFYNNDYWFMATLTMLGDFQPYFEWYEQDGISVGWDYYMGDSDLWGEYWFDTSKFEIGLDIAF